MVGTSIGAAVGGCYASGHLDAFEEWSRSLQPRSLIGYLDIQLNGSGLIGGGRLAAQLSTSIGPVQIEDLPIKFAAIATEINTGHEIWMTRGGLVEAISASYALPGIFSPVMVGDRWLVDGALVNPVPVSVARALGAEIVIAVNLSGDSFGHGATIPAQGAMPPAPELAKPDEPKRGFGKFFSSERSIKREFFGSSGRPGISTVMVEAFNIMQDRITRARLAGDPPDILISPRSDAPAGSNFTRLPTRSPRENARPSAPSSRSTKRFRSSRRRLVRWHARAVRQQIRPAREPRSGSSRLDIVAQGCLFEFVFLDASLDDVADRNQPDQAAFLDHRQMPEFVIGHGFHDPPPYPRSGKSRLWTTLRRAPVRSAPPHHARPAPAQYRVLTECHRYGRR